MQNQSVVKLKIQKFIKGKYSYGEDITAAEEPLQIQLIFGSKENRLRKSISVTMRTPGNDNELGTGFLFTEGIISKPEQISKIYSDENILEIILNENETALVNLPERNFYTSSSCGVCGKSSIESVKTVSQFKNINDDIFIYADVILSLPDRLRKQQTVFESTGGLHASALFDQQGKLIILREDVGRHNALDKIIGAAFMKCELPLTDKILLLSGRASFELIQKASMAGIRIVAAIGAPSGLAVAMAEDSGITLIGFLRDERFNVYSRGDRIVT